MRGKTGSKEQNQPLKDEGNAQEIITEVNLDQDLIEKMTDDQVAGGYSRYGRKKDVSKTTQAEVDKLDDIEADDSERSVPASKHGKKKGIAKAADVVETLNDLKADDADSTLPVFKRGRKKDVKILEVKVDKLKDSEADNAEKTVPAFQRGRKINKNLDVKNINATNDINEEASNVLKANGITLEKEILSEEPPEDNVGSKSLASKKQNDINSSDPANVVQVSKKRGRKKAETLNDLKADDAESTLPVFKRGRKKDVKILEVKVDKLKDSEADNAEKAVPASQRGRKMNKNLDVKNINATNDINEEASNVLKANGITLEKEIISEEPPEDNVGSKSLASKKQNDVNSSDPANVVQVSKKRGRKKAETKLQPKETDESASNNKQTSIEQNEEKKPSDEINENLMLCNKVSEEKDVGKRKKLIKDKILENKKLSKNDSKNMLKKGEANHVKKSDVVKCAVDIDEIIVANDTAKAEQTLKRGRKRKNKIEAIAADASEDIESEQINKYQKFTKQSSTALQDSSVVTKEVRVVLKRQMLKKSEDLTTDMELSTHSEKSIPQERGRAIKSKKGKQDEGKSDDDFQPTKSAKVPKKSENSKGSSKKEIPDVTALDFSSKSESSSGKPWNFKISSWNISGIRAWLEKNGLSYLYHEKPDILCVQETKCSNDKLPEAVRKVDGYHCYWLSGDKDGYSGVGLLTKEKPKSVNYGIDVPEHDKEGRVITAEYDQFYLVATYVPNAGRGLVRLDNRMKWDKEFCTYLKKLDEKKPVILCGDLNVAHEEMDLANPKTNKKNAGFSKEEREGFSSLLEEGFIDTFRHLYPDVKNAYTFWTYMMNARAKNVGWRLDYFVISKRFDENLCDSVIRKDVFGSDHCPITLFLSL